MPAFTTPGPITATVAVAGARVRLIASDRTDTVVLVEPVDRTSESDVRVADRTRVDFAGGRLSVRTTVSGAAGGSVAITIALPVGSGLVAYLARSDVRAEGSLGECELHLASGRVVLDRVDAVQATISSGEVVIGHVTGDAEVSSGSGAVDIGHVTGDADVSSGSGAVDIGRADGGVTARTGGGAIRIGRLTRGRANHPDRKST
ncbi:MAG: hypothetical protein HOQ46_22180, partial [Saccharothrix sp.]|nr:hypothetical protein [Saccharothrix sp.]